MSNKTGGDFNERGQPEYSRNPDVEKHCICTESLDSRNNRDLSAFSHTRGALRVLVSHIVEETSMLNSAAFCDMYGSGNAGPPLS